MINFIKEIFAEYSGALVGYLSKIVRFINDGITVVILSNREDRDEFDKICDGLFKAAIPLNNL